MIVVIKLLHSCHDEADRNLSRLFSRAGLCAGFSALADPDESNDETSRKTRCCHRHELGCYVRSLIRISRIEKLTGFSAGACGIVKAVLVVSMTSTDITYDRVDLTIWTLTEPAASIMAVSIPVL